MRLRPLQCILSFLAFLATAHGYVTPASPIVECATRAWVRAPDLAPHTIVQGDARVKISAECPAVDSVAIGLRFKERSFVKALRSREDAKRLIPDYTNFVNFVDASPWQSLPVNQTFQELREEILSNKDLWFIREEERVFFETTQPFDMGMGHHGVLRDAVQDFAILVPSTNFPPAFERMVFGVPREREILDVEEIYEYFARVSFSNGTTKDIPAGLTAFQPLHDPANVIQGLSSATIGLEQQPHHKEGKLGENTRVANYSIEISADAGLTFFAGTKHHLTAVVSRTGQARTFCAPLKVSICIWPKWSLKWAAEYDMQEADRSQFIHASVLRTTISDGDKNMETKKWRGPRCHPNDATIILPNSTLDDIQANEVVTTTSTRFIIPIELDDVHSTNFDTSYQSFYNSLTVTLKTPLVEEEDDDADDPSGERDFGVGRNELFEEDEEAWVPWERSALPSRMPGVAGVHSGQVPIVVYPGESMPPQRCLPSRTAMSESGQVVLSDEVGGCERLSLAHYLDKGARGPTFVDRSAVHTLLAEDPAERELRAPILEPVVSSPPKGEELVYRYHTGSLRNPHIYVGATWAKKVANKDRLVNAEVSGPSFPIVAVGPGAV